MPIGSYSLTAHYCEHLQKHRPKSVLDVGVGFGLTGALVRQYLDNGVYEDIVHHYGDNAGIEDSIYHWSTRLMGVEPFNYKNPAWHLYDGIFKMSIQEYLSDNQLTPSPQYDFIIFSDVIEHMEKEEGYEVIEGLIGLLNPGGVLMIGTPGVFVEQGAVHGNEYERHRSLWAWNEFPPGFEVIMNGEPDEWKHRMILVKYVKLKK